MAGSVRLADAVRLSFDMAVDHWVTPLAAMSLKVPIRQSFGLSDRRPNSWNQVTMCRLPVVQC